jgi:hypothetical protein
MMIGSYFKDRPTTSAALEPLMRLPAQLRPTHFGGDERGPVAANRLDSQERYAKFLQKNDEGHFLFAERLLVNVSPFSSQYRTVSSIRGGGAVISMKTRGRWPLRRSEAGAQLSGSPPRTKSMTTETATSPVWAQAQ